MNVAIDAILAKMNFCILCTICSNSGFSGTAFWHIVFLVALLIIEQYQITANSERSQAQGLMGFGKVVKHKMPRLFRREHLPKYAGEFAFRWNHRKITDGALMVKAVKSVEGKRLTYRQAV